MKSYIRNLTSFNIAGCAKTTRPRFNAQLRFFTLIYIYMCVCGCVGVCVCVCAGISSMTTADYIIYKRKEEKKFPKLKD